MFKDVDELNIVEDRMISYCSECSKALSINIPSLNCEKCFKWRMCRGCYNEHPCKLMHEVVYK